MFVALGIQTLKVIDPEADAKAAAEAAAKNQVTLRHIVKSRAADAFCLCCDRLVSQFTRCLFRFSRHQLIAVDALCDVYSPGAADNRRERRRRRRDQHGVHLLEAGKGIRSQVSDDE
jgi:hypothetical protein